MCAASRTYRDASGLILGLAIIAAGLLFTLDNFHVLDAGHLLSYWPGILVAIGVARLVEARTWAGYAWNLGLVVAGFWLLGEHVGLVSVSIWRLWPLALVLFGLSVLRRAFGMDDQRCHAACRDDWEPAAGSRTGGGQFDRPGESPGERVVASASAYDPTEPALDDAPPAFRGSSPRDAHISMFAMMAGVDRATDTADFRSAHMMAVMGACRLDLRDAEIAGDEAIVDVVALMGGVEILVPRHWVVESRVLPIMGGLGDETHPNRMRPVCRLVVRGVALMGGVEVKN